MSAPRSSRTSLRSLLTPLGLVLLALLFAGAVSAYGGGGQAGDPCASDGECCSAKCRGRPGAKTCR